MTAGSFQMGDSSKTLVPRSFQRWHPIPEPSKLRKTDSAGDDDPVSKDDAGIAA